jgi:hypothetical protein
MRAAAIETSGPGVATQKWRDEAEEAIARIGARQRATTTVRPPEDVEATRQKLLESLRRDDRPAGAWLALLAAGAVVMLGGAARLAWSAGQAGAWRRERLAMALGAAGAVVYAVAAMH